MPCNEAVLGALSQITERIRSGFGVTLAPHEFIHPARLAEKVATVDLLSQGRVEWGIGRSTPMEQTAFKVDRPAQQGKDARRRPHRRRHVGAGDLRGAQRIPRFPGADGHPQALSISAPAGVDGGQCGRGREDRRGDGCGLLCFTLLQPLGTLKPVIDAYREGAAKARRR